jgi:hypothetical protein
VARAVVKEVIERAWEAAVAVVAVDLAEERAVVARKREAKVASTAAVATVAPTAAVAKRVEAAAMVARRVAPAIRLVAAVVWRSYGLR